MVITVKTETIRVPLLLVALSLWLSLHKGLQFTYPCVLGAFILNGSEYRILALVGVPFPSNMESLCVYLSARKLTPAKPRPCPSQILAMTSSLPSPPEPFIFYLHSSQHLTCPTLPSFWNSFPKVCDDTLFNSPANSITILFSLFWENCFLSKSQIVCLRAQPLIFFLTLKHCSGFSQEILWSHQDETISSKEQQRSLLSQFFKTHSSGLFYQ